MWGGRCWRVEGRGGEAVSDGAGGWHLGRAQDCESRLGAPHSGIAARRSSHGGAPAGVAAERADHGNVSGGGEPIQSRAAAVSRERWVHRSAKEAGVGDRPGSVDGEQVPRYLILPLEKAHT